MATMIRNRSARRAAAAPGERPRAKPAGERRRTLSLLAHEVRAPLAVIKSQAEILIHCPPPDDASRRAFLAAIVEESDRIHRLLDDVNEVEKLESGSAPYLPAPCELDALVERAVLGLHHLAARKRIDLACERVGEAGLVPGEPQLLLRALSALVENAVKYSHFDGRVRVRTVAWEGAPTVAVEVEDEGIGVPAAAAERIFESFFQASVPPDEVSPRGSGLGLALVRLIAQRHGGAVSYQPRARGSAFVLTLPVE